LQNEKLLVDKERHLDKCKQVWSLTFFPSSSML
jgi:hypothetical protein